MTPQDPPIADESPNCGVFRHVNALLGCARSDGHAALACHDPTGQGGARWAARWKPSLKAFSITFGDRFPGAETY